MTQSIQDWITVSEHSFQHKRIIWERLETDKPKYLSNERYGVFKAILKEDQSQTALKYHPVAKSDFDQLVDSGEEYDDIFYYKIHVPSIVDDEIKRESFSPK